MVEMKLLHPVNSREMPGQQEGAPSHIGSQLTLNTKHRSVLLLQTKGDEDAQ